jgi:siroheme synthase
MKKRRASEIDPMPRKTTVLLDWAALAATQLPLVIYMGMSGLREMVEALIAGGLGPSTPVAVVENATRPSQRSCRSTLGYVVDAVALNQLTSPAVLYVGAGAAVGKQSAGTDEAPKHALMQAASIWPTSPDPFLDQRPRRRFDLTMLSKRERHTA